MARRAKDVYFTNIPPGAKVTQKTTKCTISGGINFRSREWDRGINGLDSNTVREAFFVFLS